MKNLLNLLLALVLVLLSPLSVAAQDSQNRYDEKTLRKLGIFFVETTPPKTCVVSGAQQNIDYAGNKILTDGQLEKINANRPIYEKSAQKVGVPWQMLAIIHLLEHSGEISNPDNGQGIYQFLSKQGGPYPTGPVDAAEFQRQTDLAAEFIKNKAKTSNYPENQNLNAATTDPAVIKDTFFSYNGRNPGYIDQAVSLGFTDKQGYEGSPYVMNKADARRDPGVAPRGTWGQVKKDHGPIEYPANNFHGAFLKYGAIAGVSTSCTVAGVGQLAWPLGVPSRITSCFGPRIHPVSGESQIHGGLDMAKASGSPVLAAADGEVESAGPADGYGNNYVVIKHGEALKTSYGHMDSMLVKAGDQVTRGQQIGTEGNQGVSTAPHLHFNVFEKSGAVNPLKYVAAPTQVTNLLQCK